MHNDNSHELEVFNGVGGVLVERVCVDKHFSQNRSFVISRYITEASRSSQTRSLSLSGH